MPIVTFNNQKAFFFRTIQTEVEQYFDEKNIKKTGNLKLYLKCIILVVVAIATYVVLLAVDLHPAIAIVLCCLLGLALAGIGFNVMHDANHGSFSGKKWINSTMGFSLNIMGGNAWFWKQKHNIIHHTYTNIDGVDEDIVKPPLLRMCTSQKHLKVHRYQYIYCVFLYGLTSLMWIFVTDFAKYFQNKIQSTKLRKMESKEHVIFWVSKALYFVFFILLPILMVGFIPFIIGFIILQFTLGIALSLVFQLAHVVEATHFEDAKDDALRINDEWAVHQVRTTADFATNNKIISWFTGGLNFQVEHHLFPQISHVHYPVIHTIVKQACQKYSVPFNQYPSMTAALISHFRFLKQLGVG